jgi:ParB family chromosome partitioning protein
MEGVSTVVDQTNPAVLDTADQAAVEIPVTSDARPRLHLRWVDPRTLLNNPHNVRTDLGDLTGLRDSIADNGVWNALYGTEGTDGIALVDGHRRAAAAVAAIEELNSELAREIPVMVATNEVLTAEQFVAMLSTSIHRKSLTISEEAFGYQQLTLEGWTVDQIAKRIGRKKAHVEASITLAKQSATIQRAVDNGDLNLEDSDAIDEFEDDPKALNRILAKGNSWAVRNQIAEERRKRTIAQTAAALHQELTAEGVVLISKPKEFPYRSREAEVSTLRGPDGEIMLPNEVRAQPGFAAFIDTSAAEAKAVVVCLNPEAHAFTRRANGYGGGYATPEEAARREAQRVAEEAQKAALDTAAEVRRTFLTETYGSAKAAKALYVEALRAALDREFIREGKRHATLVTALTGTNPETVDLAEAAEARLSRLLVGLWIASREDNVENVADDRFSADKPAMIAWFDRLVTAGYSLSDAEQTLYDAISAEQSDACRHCGATSQEYHDDDCPNADEDVQEQDNQPAEQAPVDSFAVQLDADRSGWQLVNPAGEVIGEHPDPDADSDQAAAWAAALLQDDGRPVTGWRVQNHTQTGERLVAEFGDDQTAAGAPDETPLSHDDIRHDLTVAA